MAETNPQEKELSYDLRQYRAKEIGEQILRVADAQDHDPATYFFELEKLYIAIHHKIKKRTDGEKTYQRYYEEITVLSKKYLSAWNGNKKDNNYNILKQKLQELHRWLRLQMEEANLFGGTIEKDPAKMMGRST